MQCKNKQRNELDLTLWLLFTLFFCSTYYQFFFLIQFLKGENNFILSLYHYIQCTERECANKEIENDIAYCPCICVKEVPIIMGVHDISD